MTGVEIEVGDRVTCEFYEKRHCFLILADAESEEDYPSLRCYSVEPLSFGWGSDKSVISEADILDVVKPEDFCIAEGI